MPTNLYGPGDNFDLASSHVVPALMRKIDEARAKGASQVEIWGIGTPRREFLYVDDLADACVFLLKHYTGNDHVNVGTGVDLTIRELAETIARVVGYRGGFVYDRSKPDGTPRKLMDVSRLAALGWRASTSLESGLKQSYDWFVAHRREVALRLSGSLLHRTLGDAGDEMPGQGDIDQCDRQGGQGQAGEEHAPIGGELAHEDGQPLGQGLQTVRGDQDQGKASVA